jgi:hypothetical protein
MRTSFYFTFTSCALFTLLSAGCNGETPYPGLIAPPDPGKGVQYRMEATIEPGQEAERCKFVQAPPEGLQIQRDEVALAPGVHHFLLFEMEYDQIPTENDDGAAIDTSDVFDCSAGPAAGWSVKKLMAGSQNAEGGSYLDFPDGVAMSVAPGAVLMLNAHLLNATSEPIETEANINLYTLAKSEVEVEGDALFLYDAFIAVRAQSQGRARVRCPVYTDITLLNFQSHMHRRGVGYQAAVDDGAPFYENGQWEDVPVKDLGEGLAIAKGSVIDFACDYTNSETHDIFQGPKSTDEMCIAIGAYYPAEPNTSACAIFGVDGTRNMGGDWVGNGTLTCAETMSCVQSAITKENFDQELMLCVNDSDPAKSEVMSDALRCLATAEDPFTQCDPEFTACMAN